MADIAVADVTAKILYRKPYAPDSEQPTNEPLIHVRVGITVDPGTDDAYPTGGIPLDNLFTAGNASDTKLDVTKPIYQKGIGLMRAAAATFTPVMPAFYHQAGATAATQKLRLYLGAANASAVAHAEHGNSDITAATSFNGDTDPYVEIDLIGTLRPGETL